ncbi:hypothetical protein Dimus_002592 [Dionaea muscipula]
MKQGDDGGGGQQALHPSVVEQDAYGGRRRMVMKTAGQRGLGMVDGGVDVGKGGRSSWCLDGDRYSVMARDGLVVVLGDGWW